MAGLKGPASRQSIYSRTGVPRLWRSAPALLVAGALAFSAGGCSFSYQLDSLWGKSETDAKPAVPPSAKPAAGDNITTGSTGPMAMAAHNPALPPREDLIHVRAAASAVLGKSAKGASQPWENERTGARGTVTALAAAYTQDGFTCRDFLASYVKGKREAWMQGEACRIHHGKWTVKSLKPWKRT